MQPIVAYVIAHQAELAAGAGALYTLLSVVNGLIHSPKANTVLGDILDVISYISRKGAAGSVKAPFTRSTAPSEPVVDGASARALLPLLLVPLVAMSACAGLQPLPRPTPAQYRQALVSCLENAGERQALPVGEQIVACFSKPGETVAQYEMCAEQGAATLGEDAGLIVVQCAVDSWIDFNPAPVSAPPKPALLAARNVRARHLRLHAGRL